MKEIKAYKTSTGQIVESKEECMEREFVYLENNLRLKINSAINTILGTLNDDRFIFIRDNIDRLKDLVKEIERLELGRIQEIEKLKEKVNNF